MARNLRVPKDMSDWPVDRQRVFAKKIETTIGEHYKLLQQSPPKLVLHARAGFAKLENGTLGAWTTIPM